MLADFLLKGLKKLEWTVFIGREADELSPHIFSLKTAQHNLDRALQSRLNIEFSVEFETDVSAFC